MAPPDTPKKTSPRKSSTSKSTEGINRTQTSLDTPQLSSRERKPQSLSSSGPTRTLRSQSRIDDSDLLAFGMDLQASAQDESSLPSPGPSQSSQGNDQPSSSVNGGKQSGLKKRRRLSVRPDNSQSSRSDPVASTANQNIPPGKREQSIGSNRFADVSRSCTNDQHPSAFGKLLESSLKPKPIVWLF